MRGLRRDRRQSHRHSGALAGFARNRELAAKNGYREYCRTSFMGDEVILLERG